TLFIQHFNLVEHTGIKRQVRRHRDLVEEIVHLLIQLVSSSFHDQFHLLISPEGNRQPAVRDIEELSCRNKTSNKKARIQANFGQFKLPKFPFREINSQNPYLETPEWVDKDGC